MSEPSHQNLGTLGKGSSYLSCPLPVLTPVFPAPTPLIHLPQPQISQVASMERRALGMRSGLLLWPGMKHTNQTIQAWDTSIHIPGPHVCAVNTSLNMSPFVFADIHIFPVHTCVPVGV